ncbi:MAG: GTP-binding protein [Candidatus Lokiarchaeota archaeon]|nr:GTP-binding protein [Candidatus Lokiarchaeota archaeon]MBD3202583.1 GTP-binding protein [Candidatus Lokiarchaeota archaeon]
MHLKWDKGERLIESDIELAYKICVFGNSQVGKTSLVLRFITNTFKTNVQSTLGAAIHVKTLKFKGRSTSLQIWDFGGENKFRFLLPSYAKGSSAAIFMIDITNDFSYNNYEEWISVFKRGAGQNAENIPILLVGGKLDLKQDREVFREDLEDLLEKEIFFNYLECSAKTGENVEDIFNLTLRKIYSSNK